MCFDFAHYFIIRIVVILAKVDNNICFRGKRVYEEPRYMTVSQASKQIMEAIETRKDPLKRERGC